MLLMNRCALQNKGRDTRGARVLSFLYREGRGTEQVFTPSSPGQRTRASLNPKRMCPFLLQKQKEHGFNDLRMGEWEIAQNVEAEVEKLGSHWRGPISTFSKGTKKQNRARGHCHGGWGKYICGELWFMKVLISLLNNELDVLPQYYLSNFFVI